MKGIQDSRSDMFYRVSILSGSRVIILPVVLIMVAEMLIYFRHAEAGFIFHTLALLLLTLFVMWIPDSHISRSMQMLLLLPIFRFLNLTMPVFSETTLDVLFYIYLPMLLPAYLVIRHQDLELSGVSMRVFLKSLPGYLLLSCVVGAIIAWGEFQIIEPESLIPDLSLINLLKLSLIMIFIVGFVEELIFRFLLQGRMEISFGRSEGLIIVSLLFGFMHSGYGTLYEIVYVSCVGLVLGYMFQKTGSLSLVSLTHGFANIFLFGLIPLLPYFNV
ncbi:CPBP family intramembrane glutamic endopeptidase [Methanolobus halotolerans]|uniref:CPBP family intramembrane metalloprotease domain-containing protein n=1 Tax=Methanolobus halotolerans TaxID=2052935 RepID=A0A4E0PWM9_9EURY|nr:type II CAAX endopeptidase family protein [Methanolobus halotolerans]TGC10525.1 CPBP family intramembrane metalloprotease domain-containing protein [Methanolobus halotolerans]